LDSFLALNDSKATVDHETGEMPHDFWDDVVETMNGSDDDDSSALQLVIEEANDYCGEIKSIDLRDFNQMTCSAIMKKVNQLLKVRKEMKKNMTISGEHDNNPYNFVEITMKNVGKGGLSVLGCHYFYTRCESNPEVDVCFVVEMDDALKGNTADIELLKRGKVYAR